MIFWRLAVLINAPKSHSSESVLKMQQNRKYQYISFAVFLNDSKTYTLKNYFVNIPLKLEEINVFFYLTVSDDNN